MLPAPSLLRPLPGLVLASALFGCAGAALADTASMIEVGALHHNVSAGYGDWDHKFVRANVRSAPGSLWNGELVHARRFGDSGTLAVLGHTRDFGQLWYGSASIASSSGGFFFPSLRLDLTAHRRWGAQHKLVTTAGLTMFNAKDGHRDRSVLLGAAYYFDLPLVLEGGVRFNRSNPGAVTSRANYLAATYGRDKERIISFQHGFGREAYQLIGPDALLVGLDSKVDTLTWREWLRARQGFQLRAERYSTPFYHRQGIEFALFQEF